MPKKKTAATDEQRQDELRKEQRLKQTVEEQDLRRVLLMPEGQRVIARILDGLGVGPAVRPVMFYDHNGALDASATLTLAAERTAGAELIQVLMSVAPELYEKMFVAALRDKAHELRRARDMKREED